MKQEPQRAFVDGEIVRHVPYDVEIEQALLGAVLVENSALDRFSSVLRSEHFYDPLHRRIYGTMLVQRGETQITPLTLNSAMKADPGLIEVGGHAYLAGLAAAAPAMPNVRDYARILHDLAVRRDLVRIGEDIVNSAYEAPNESSVLTRVELADAALRGLREKEADHLGADTIAALSAAAWCARDLPEPDRLLGYLLSTTSRVMLVAATGLGKTNIALHIGTCMASGSDCLHWRAVRPARVLFIDGEMSRRLMRSRIADAIRRHGGMPETLFVLCRDDVPDRPPLNTIEGQRFIDRQIEKLGGIEFIIFDNVQALIVGDMKDEESWEQTLPWIKSLTSRSIGQMWVHHTGLNTSRSYGTSTREWQLDTVAVMEKVERTDTDIAFTLKFSKARERAPHNREDFAEVVVTLVDDQWRSEPAESEKLKPVTLTAGETGWFRDLVSIFAEQNAPVQTLSPASGMTPQQTLTRDYVRERFKQKGRFTQKPDGALTGSDRQKMSAALNALRDKRKIGMTDRLVWLLQERQ